MFQSFENSNRVQVLGRTSEGQDILAPVDGITRIMGQEFEKGVRSGMLLVRNLPVGAEELYNSLAQKIRADMAEEQGDE